MLTDPRKRIYKIFIQLLLIIVGVLTALAVDNYRESIQEHKAEKEYLINLRNSVQEDTVVLKNVVQKTYAKINAIRELLELANSATVIEDDKFANLITDVIMLIHPNYITAVYEELKFTGNFKLIHNNELKLEIISYYNNMAIIQRENDKDSGYPLGLIDQLTFDEMEYKVPFDQKRIFKVILTNEAVRNELLRAQKRASLIRLGMIYTSMPSSIELLEKLQVEIDK